MRPVGFQDIAHQPRSVRDAGHDAFEGIHVVGLSILSGSHVPLVQEVLARLADSGLAEVPVVVGGIIPPEDEALLRKAGVAGVFTPKDFDLTAIMADIVEIVDAATKEAA